MDRMSTSLDRKQNLKRRLTKSAAGFMIVAAVAGCGKANSSESIAPPAAASAAEQFTGKTGSELLVATTDMMQERAGAMIGMLEETGFGTYPTPDLPGAIIFSNAEPTNASSETFADPQILVKFSPGDNGAEGVAPAASELFFLAGDGDEQVQLVLAPRQDDSLNQAAIISGRTPSIADIKTMLEAAEPSAAFIKSPSAAGDSQLQTLTDFAVYEGANGGPDTLSAILPDYSEAPASGDNIASFATASSNILQAMQGRLQRVEGRADSNRPTPETAATAPEWYYAGGIDLAADIADTLAESGGVQSQSLQDYYGGAGDGTAVGEGIVLSYAAPYANDATKQFSLIIDGTNNYITADAWIQSGNGDSSYRSSVQISFPGGTPGTSLDDARDALKNTPAQVDSLSYIGLTSFDGRYFYLNPDNTVGETMVSTTNTLGTTPDMRLLQAIGLIEEAKETKYEIITGEESNRLKINKAYDDVSN